MVVGRGLLPAKGGGKGGGDGGGERWAVGESEEDPHQNHTAAESCRSDNAHCGQERESSRQHCQWELPARAPVGHPTGMSRSSDVDTWWLSGYSHNSTLAEASKNTIINQQLNFTNS
jgi:hypothetical protein